MSSKRAASQSEGSCFKKQKHKVMLNCHSCGTCAIVCGVLLCQAVHSHHTCSTIHMHCCLRVNGTLPVSPTSQCYWFRASFAQDPVDQQQLLQDSILALLRKRKPGATC